MRSASALNNRSKAHSVSKQCWHTVVLTQGMQHATPRNRGVVVSAAGAAALQLLLLVLVDLKLK